MFRYVSNHTFLYYSANIFTGLPRVSSPFQKKPILYCKEITISNFYKCKVINLLIHFIRSYLWFWHNANRNHMSNRISSHIWENQLSITFTYFHLSNDISLFVLTCLHISSSNNINHSLKFFYPFYYTMIHSFLVSKKNQWRFYMSLVL